MRTLLTLFLIAACAINTPARAQNDACFDDQHLLKLQSSSKQRGALVYVWSPRMVYSVQNAAIASRAAAAAGLNFVVLHDMRVPSNELLEARLSGQGQAAQRSSEPLAEIDLATPPFVSPLESSLPLCSSLLIQRDALRHFPTAFVINAQGGIHPHAVVGAMPWPAWMSSLDQRLHRSPSARP
jgi:hypothetical protein